jgi:hypothetical protein
MRKILRQSKGPGIKKKSPLRVIRGVILMNDEL